VLTPSSLVSERTSSVLVAKVKRSVLLVLHVPSVSVALAPRSPVALTAHAVKIAVKVGVVMVTVPASLTVPVVKIAVKEAVVRAIVPASQTVPVAKIAVKEAVVRVIVRASQTAHVAKIAAKVVVVMVIVRASQTVPVVKIAVKEAVVMVIVRASQIVHVVKIAVKVVVPRKKMKGDCGLMIASATAMKRGVNVLGISALSISRPSLEVAMSSY